MKFRVCIFLLFLILFLSMSDVLADENLISDDLNFILRHQNISITDSPENNQRLSEKNKIKEHSTSELSLAGKSVIKLYQTVISSQDFEACNFYPSCSHFASDALEQAGFVKGLLLTADRLTRCHWFARPQRFDSETHIQKITDNKIYDPMEYYQSGE
jgi:uncharacterized protein